MWKDLTCAVHELDEIVSFIHSQAPNCMSDGGRAREEDAGGCAGPTQVPARCGRRSSCAPAALLSHSRSASFPGLSVCVRSAPFRPVPPLPRLPQAEAPRGQAASQVPGAGATGHRPRMDSALHPACRGSLSLSLDTDPLGAAARSRLCRVEHGGPGLGVLGGGFPRACRRGLGATHTRSSVKESPSSPEPLGTWKRAFPT